MYSSSKITWYQWTKTRIAASKQAQRESMRYYRNENVNHIEHVSSTSRIAAAETKNSQNSPKTNLLYASNNLEYHFRFWKSLILISLKTHKTEQKFQFGALRKRRKVFVLKFRWINIRSYHQDKTILYIFPLDYFLWKYLNRVEFTRIIKAPQTN